MHFPCGQVATGAAKARAIGFRGPRGHSWQALAKNVDLMDELKGKSWKIMEHL